MPKQPFVDFRAVKAAVSMEQVLQHYHLIDTFKRGADSLSGPCPIHKGKNPTQFRVSLSKNCWNCFSDCKCGGNVLDFVAKMEGIDIHVAALKLAEWFNLDVEVSSEDEPPPGKPVSPKTNATRKEKPPVSEGLAKVEELGCNKPLGFTLKELDATHPYLSERGLLPETIAEFGLGYCAKGTMTGHVVIPIHNAEGQLLAYAGRWPGEPPDGKEKYKLPAGFKKTAELFNLHRALAEPKEQPLVIVEGFFDVLKLWQAGVRKTVALMGSQFSPAQEELVIRNTTSQGSVLLMFDEDDAGWLCREQAMLRLCPRRFVKVVSFATEGQQPDQLSAEGLAAMLA